jgi:TLD
MSAPLTRRSIERASEQRPIHMRRIIESFIYESSIEYSVPPSVSLTSTHGRMVWLRFSCFRPRAEEDGDEHEHRPSAGPAAVPAGPTLLGVPANRDGVLSEPALRLLNAALPSITRLRPWSLAYCTRRDGLSLQTLLRKTAGRSPLLLALRTTTGAVAGAFTTAPWRYSPRHFGSGESWVFSVAASGQPIVFGWTGANTFFQLCIDGSWLAVGGGQSGPALRLEGDLASGSTGACETYASPPLIRGPVRGEPFQIAAVEVWAFDGKA